MKLAIYILICMCAALPLVFNHKRWIRTASLVVLAGLIGLYMMGLQTSGRLATTREYQQTKQPSSLEWIDGTIKTRQIIEESHPMGILLFVALIILAAVPIRTK